MVKKYWTVKEVIEIFQVEEHFINELEEEKIICPIKEKGQHDKLYPLYEVEKLRLAKILIEEMEVNIPGVEMILRMRRDLLDMRKQFDAILDDLAEKIRKEL